MRYLAIAVFLMSFWSSSAQDEIRGLWLAGEGKTKVKIMETSSGAYEGKVIWLKDSVDRNGNPRVDRKNPDANLRDRPIVGISILEEIVFEDGAWNAMIYAPKRGRRLPCKLTIDELDQLNIEVSVMGMTRNQVWTKADL